MTPHRQLYFEFPPHPSPKPHGSVYRIRNRVNGKVYIGQTVQPVNLRWNQHVCKARHGKNVPFSNAIVKYGRDAFEVSELTDAIDQAVLNLKEKLLIRAYRSMEKGIGYNCRTGGANGKLTEEHKRKIGAANAISLKGKKSSPEANEKRSIKLRGRKNKPHTAETRAKIGTAGRGRVPSEETRRRLSDAGRARNWKPSRENVAKMTAARLANRAKRMASQL